MSPDLLGTYLTELDEAIAQLNECDVELYRTELLAPNRANVALRIRFFSGALFEGNEAVAMQGSSLEHLGYRYHAQDERNNLLFRYDNAPHFRNLASFPHHKHVADEVVECTKPHLIEAMSEAVRLCGLAPDA